MYLAIGIQFELGLTGSIGVDNLDIDDIIDNLTDLLGCKPDDIIVVQTGFDGPEVVLHHSV